MTQADEWSLGDWLAAEGPPLTPEAMLEMLRGAQRRVVVYPGADARDFTGQSILPYHVKDFRPDMFWTVGDVWPFQATADMAAKGMFVWGVWAYVDFDWTDPAGLLDHLSRAAVVVPTSVWLERRLRAMGLSPTAPVALGVNTEAFKPLVGEKDDLGQEITPGRLKRGMGLPEDCFLVGLVQMNQLDRKPFEEQLEGFRLFRDANPDAKPKIYLHTYPHSAQGYNLPVLLKEMGLGPDSFFADDYRWLKGVLGYGDAAMSRIYNTMDVLLQGTSGDSPGMPLLEAQACLPKGEPFVHGIVSDISEASGTFLGNSVIENLSRQYDGDMVKLRPRGLDERSLTPEHPVFTARGWVRAGELTETDLLAIPRLGGEEEVDPRWARVVGLYTGDGYVEKTRNNWGGFIIALSGGVNRRFDFAIVKDLLRAGFPCTWHPTKVHVKDRFAAAWLRDNIGTEAGNKRIPDAVFLWNEEGRREFLKGYFMADGHYERRRCKPVITTVSRHLAYDLILLGASLGVRGQLQVKRTAGPGLIKGRPVHLGKTYMISFQGKQVEKLGFRYSLKRPIERWHLADSANVWVPIRSIRKEKFRGVVYNVRTTNGTFQVPFTVHNCGTPVLATDFVGIPEHVAGGELIKVAGLFRPPEKPQMAKAVPDPDSIARGLETIYNKGREAYSTRGREFALRHTWDAVLEGWLRILEDARREIDRRTLVPPLPAAGLASLSLPS